MILPCITRTLNCRKALYQTRVLKNDILLLLFLSLGAVANASIESLGVPDLYLPNFFLSIIFSYIFISSPTQLVVISLFGFRSLLQANSILEFCICVFSYYLIYEYRPKGIMQSKKLDIMIFSFMTLVLYSAKIFSIYIAASASNYLIILIKMLVTILLFPLFYLTINKIQKGFG